MEAVTYLDGERIELPQSAQEARDRGWYQAVAFMPPFLSTNLYYDMHTWCEDTFDPRLWRNYINGVWFYRRRDRDWFILRWGDTFRANPGDI
jgi:hypothetical protein